MEGAIAVTVPAVLKATQQERGRKSSEAEDAAELWIILGGLEVSLLSISDLHPDGHGAGGAVPGSAALALTRFVVIGNRTAEEVGMLFLWKCPGTVNQGRGKQTRC